MVLASEKEVWKGRNDTITEKAKGIPGYRVCGSDEQVFVLDVDGKVITFYYVKLTGYTVKYLDVDTWEPLGDDKIVSGIEVGSEITEVAIPIPGYNALAPTEITMVMEESGNEFIFYYEKL